ncbi:MAG: POTRA domain-containing protein [Acidobacteriota bacterium]|nr:POTRA domain-containing protein [Acidobacteriota bacterium]
MLGVLLGTLVGAVAQGTGEGQDCSTIYAIEVRGNRRMSADAVRFDLGIKPGDPWNEAQIRREYRRFWERGYFSDLRFFKRCDPEGAVLIVELEERPTILEVDYQKVKAVSQQQIEDYYEERDFTLGVGSPLDRKKLWRAEALIRDLLGQKGYLDAKVKAVVEERSPSTRSVFFRIVPGGKTKIRKLDFVGNKAFKDGKLKDRLELTREWRWWWPFSRKALYHPLKYQQDVTHVLQYYRDHGYLDVDVRPPIVEIKTVRSRRAEDKARRRAEREARKKRRKAERERRKQAKTADLEDELPPLPLARGDRAGAEADADLELEVKEKKWVYLTIPVEEGEVYRLGEITFEGNQLFDDRFLRALFPLREGSVLADGAIEAGLERIKQFYGRRGYVYAVASRRFERHEGEFVADVVVQIDEDQAYTIDTIEFRGNTTTRDEVLRRG